MQNKIFLISQEMNKFDKKFYFQITPIKLSSQPITYKPSLIESTNTKIFI